MVVLVLFYIINLNICTVEVILFSNYPVAIIQLMRIKGVQRRNLEMLGNSVFLMNECTASILACYWTEHKCQEASALQVLYEDLIFMMYLFLFG